MSYMDSSLCNNCILVQLLVWNLDRRIFEFGETMKSWLDNYHYYGCCEWVIDDWIFCLLLLPFRLWLDDHCPFSTDHFLKNGHVEALNFDFARKYVAYTARQTVDKHFGDFLVVGNLDVGNLLEHVNCDCSSCLNVAYCRTGLKVAIRRNDQPFLLESFRAASRTRIWNYCWFSIILLCLCCCVVFCQFICVFSSRKCVFL